MTGNETQLPYQPKSCLFCEKGTGAKPLYPQTFRDGDLSPQVFSARRVTEHFHYNLVRCRGCRLVYSNPILPDNVLEPLYADSAVTFSEYSSVLKRDYWRPLAPHWNQQGGTALEIGCSSGFFLEELKAHGFDEVYGAEPSREAKQKADPSVRDGIHSGFFQGTETFPDKKFDLVCSFHTLDHITDPLKFIKNVKQVLAPNGMVYFVTHDVDALQAKLLGEKSPIFDIEHIYLFNKDHLAALLERHGFDVVDVGNLKNSYPLNYWSKMAPLPKPLKSAVQGVFNATGLGEAAPALPMGNIFVIGRSRQ